MAAAKEEIEGDVEMEPEIEDDGVNEEMEDNANATEVEKGQNFVKELVEAGYDQGLAIRALQFIDPEDVTAGKVDIASVRIALQCFVQKL